MNPQKQKYAIERLEEIAHSKINKLTKPKEPSLSTYLDEAIANGTIKFKSQATIIDIMKKNSGSSYRSRDISFQDICAEPKEYTDGVKKYKYLNENYQKQVKQIQDKVTQLKDMIMLGSEEQALEAIREMSNF
jgi:gas vesicle protein